ncbi:MAG: MBL fold metallo-hydrolase [Actinomycetota bacterium]|nr:MBL fold metallo-hydrolase [Actinomycetota bacterium]
MSEPSGVQVVQLDTASLGNRSYVVVRGGRAIVVDPPRDIDRVEQVLAQHRAVVDLVVETHHHADYLSGGLELSRRHGTRYAVPGAVAFDHLEVGDGAELAAAGLTLRAMSTPGHTTHHLSWVLSTEGQDTAVFTGGSMLYGAVGRTDLVSPELTVALSRDQWASVRRLGTQLTGAVDIYPTHGFGSFCSATPTSGTESTVAQQRSQNPACTTARDDFVAELLAGYDAYPAYYAHLPAVNAEGPAPIDLSPPPAAGAAELRDRLEAGEWVLDLRPRADFAAEHVAGTYNLDVTGSIAVYVGWLIPWGITPVTLLGATSEQVATAQRELARIGIDRPATVAVGSPQRWAGSAAEVWHYPRADFADLAKARGDRDVFVLDTRRQAEWAQGHLDGAVHVPLHELIDRIEEIPTGQELWVHCASGFRASIAASVLDAAGRTVVLVDDEFADAADQGHHIVVPEAAAIR